jgi:hypothetical protein
VSAVAEALPASVRRADEEYERSLAVLAKHTRKPLAAAVPVDVELIDASSLAPEPIRWIWPGWIARGKLLVLAGAPGTGKTTIAGHLVSCVSAGHAFPCGFRPKAGRALIWSGEDDPTDTLLPRLIAAGADLSRVHFIGDVRENGERRFFDPARDVPKLAAAIAGMDDVALIVIDPLVSAVSGDSHKNAEVRRGLAPLVDLAAKIGAALIGITHYSKGTQGRDPLERVSGSLAFGALARIVLGTVKLEAEEGQPQRMMLARAKSNIGPDGGGFAYAIEQAEPRDGIVASRIAWGAAVEGTARELLADPESDTEHGEARDAVDWLREELAAGPVSVKDVKRHADDAGFAWRTVQRAMRSAGVDSKRAGFGMPATWALAPVAPENPQSRQSRQPSEYGANGKSGATDAGAATPETVDL